MLRVSYLLAFLLCLSLHTCHSRHLTVANKESREEDLQQSINKREEKEERIVGGDVDEKSLLLSSNNTKMAHDGNGKGSAARVYGHHAQGDDTGVHPSSQIIHSSKGNAVVKRGLLIKGRKIINSIQHNAKHHDSTVTWKVPRNKETRQQQHDQPEFNLDYAGPHTHPPSHN